MPRAASIRDWSTCCSPTTVLRRTGSSAARVRPTIAVAGPKLKRERHQQQHAEGRQGLAEAADGEHRPLEPSRGPAG